MKILPAILLPLLSASLSAGESSRGGQVLYLASIADKTVASYDLDAESGALARRAAVDLPGNPGPLALSPDGSFLYAAMTGLKGGKAGVATLKRSADGSLALVSTAYITSRAPYIRTDRSGRLLLAAHYGAGDVTVYRISDGICTGELLDQKKTERTAHCIEIDPTGRFVFVPHTEPNKVFQFRLNTETGKLTPNQPPHVDGPEEGHDYHAPRHFAMHPKLSVAYTSNEFGGGITAWKFDPNRGTLSRMQTLSTLPADYQGKSAAADIHLTPDGRFAYVSNRDTTERAEGEAMQDTLAAFALDEQTGRMESIGTFPTAHFPRSFCIDGSGRFLYAAGQRSATLFAYRIDTRTGKLQRFATYQTGANPIWVVCADVEP